MAYLVATTNRTSDDPLLHALYDTRPPYSPHGNTYVAACRAQVANVRGERFDPNHKRACPKCADRVTGLDGK